MRKMILTSFLILVGCLQVHARTVELLNFGWKFQRGNAEKASQVDFDDRDWKSIDCRMIIRLSNLGLKMVILNEALRNSRMDGIENPFLQTPLGWVRRFIWTLKA